MTNPMDEFTGEPMTKIIAVLVERVGKCLTEIAGLRARVATLENKGLPEDANGPFWKPAVEPVPAPKAKKSK